MSKVLFACQGDTRRAHDDTTRAIAARAPRKRGRLKWEEHESGAKRQVVHELERRHAVRNDAETSSRQQLLAQTYTRPDRGTKVRTTQMGKTTMPTRSTLFLLVVPILVLLSFIVRVERWFDAGGLEFGHVISSDTSSGLRGGKVALEDRDLVICSLVRDSARNIIQNLNVVEEVAKHFRIVKFIIVENDSTDGTDKLLQEWAATRGDYVELISMKIDDSLNIFLPGMPKHETNYDLSTRRFAKMALLRNIYLEKLTVMPQTSDPNAIVMIVDLDLHSIPASETVESLRSTIAGERKMSPGWEAFCTNGITSVCIPDILGTEGCTFVRRDNGEFGRAYDGLAARFTDEEMKHSFVIQPGEEEPPDHVKNWYGHQIRGGLKLNDVNADPVPVKSCFGGIAVYKATKLKGLRYEGGDCEHLSVHRKLKNIYIIPDFNVYYD